MTNRGLLPGPPAGAIGDLAGCDGIQRQVLKKPEQANDEGVIETGRRAFPSMRRE